MCVRVYMYTYIYVQFVVYLVQEWLSPMEGARTPKIFSQWGCIFQLIFSLYWSLHEAVSNTSKEISQFLDERNFQQEWDKQR